MTDKPARGGHRKGAGRKPVADTPTKHYTVTLDDRTVEAVREYGDWNLSAGIRKASRRVSMWKTIDSAPKDGTDVLVCDGENYAVAHWDGSEWRDIGDIGWSGMCGDGNQPTHWQPLPAAPDQP